MKQIKFYALVLLGIMLSINQVWAATTINFGFSDWGESAAFSGTTKDEVSQTKDDVVVTYTRNGSSLYANTTSLRFYKSNTLTFEAPDGYAITGIEFTCSSYQTDITSSVGTCSATSSALSWSGTADQVTFTRPSNASSYATISSASVTLSSGSTYTDLFSDIYLPSSVIVLRVCIAQYHPLVAVSSLMLCLFPADCIRHSLRRYRPLSRRISSAALSPCSLGDPERPSVNAEGAASA